MGVTAAVIGISLAAGAGSATLANRMSKGEATMPPAAPTLATPPPEGDRAWAEFGQSPGRGYTEYAPAPGEVLGSDVDRGYVEVGDAGAPPVEVSSSPSGPPIPRVTSREFAGANAPTRAGARRRAAGSAAARSRTLLTGPSGLGTLGTGGAQKTLLGY